MIIRTLDQIDKELLPFLVKGGFVTVKLPNNITGDLQKAVYFIDHFRLYVTYKGGAGEFRIYPEQAKDIELTIFD